MSYSLRPSRRLHQYILDFDITTFYSPATLSVIDHFFVSVNAFRDRDTPVQLGYFSGNIAVSYSFVKLAIDELSCLAGNIEPE